jgi:hypothetical protein
MASDLSFVEYVRDQISGAGPVSDPPVDRLLIYCYHAIYASSFDRQS